MMDSKVGFYTLIAPELWQAHLYAVAANRPANKPVNMTAQIAFDTGGHNGWFIVWVMEGKGCPLSAPMARIWARTVRKQFRPLKGGDATQIQFRKAMLAMSRDFMRLASEVDCMNSLGAVPSRGMVEGDIAVAGHA